MKNERSFFMRNFMRRANSVSPSQSIPHTFLKMALTSFLGKLFSDNDSQSRYWNLVDRISTITRSSLDLDSVLGVAAREMGKALDAARCRVLLDGCGPRPAAQYCAPWIGSTAVGNFESLDADLARESAIEIRLVEIEDAASDPRVNAFFHRGLISSTSRQQIRSILIAPLVVESQAIGTIITYRSKSSRWTKEEKRFVRTLASSLSLTIHQIQSQEKARSAANREAIFNRLLTAISSALDIESVLNVAAQGIGAALGVTRAVIYTRPDGQVNGGAGSDSQSLMTARAEYRASVLVPSLLESKFALEDGPAQEKFYGGEIIAIPDTHETDLNALGISAGLGVRALALAPIAYNGESVAALALEQFDQSREFSEEEVKLIRLVTEQMAVALYQAELYRGAQEAARREALIGKISSAIRGSLDSGTVLQTIVNELGAALSVCRCRLALLPENKVDRTPISQEYVADCCKDRQLALQTIPVYDNAHLKRVLDSDKPVATDDIMMEPKLAPTREWLSSAGVKSMLATAIRLGNRPIGFFSLHHCEQHHSWTQWEMDVVESVAEQAAVAIRQAELYREARESATRATLVNQIMSSIRRSLDLQETLQVAVKEVGRTLNASRTHVRKVDGEEIAVLAEHLSDPALSLSQVPAMVGDYIMQQLVETRRTLIMDDTRAFIAAHPQLAATVLPWQVEHIALSEIICPIFVNGEFWGALVINQTDRIRKWTANDIALAEVVTAQIEVAVSHSHLFEEAKQSAQREALVSHIVNGINQSNRLDEILPIAAGELSEHLAADRILISRFDETDGGWTVECDYSEGASSRPLRGNSGVGCETLTRLMRNGPILCQDVENAPELATHIEDIFGPEPVRAFAMVGLFYRNAPRLVITAAMKSKPRAWSHDEAEIMRAAADQVFIALERAELFEQISRGKYEWESTFDALSDGILIFDQDGLLRRVNDAGAAYESSSVHELIGRRCCTLLQGIEGEKCMVAEVVKTGRPVTFELTPEKLARPVLVTISPLKGQYSPNNGTGKGINNGAWGAVCIVRDLSELREAEAVARKQRGFLAKLIEHANDAIFALSTQGRLIWFNEQLVKLLGHWRDDLTNSHYSQFVSAGDKEVVAERFARAIAGRAQTFEMHAIKKSGETRLLLATYTPIYEEGHVTSVLSIARDITEERLASERAAQADKLRALGQLASGVAHNFNNILAAILGHAQLIKRDSRDERTIRQMGIIESAALDGAQTVKRIQGFGQQHDQTIYESVDVNQLVQDSTELTRARWRDDAQARGLTYEVEVDLQPTPIALGAASELREIFVNIILNALDAMPRGGRLRIHTEATDSEAQIHFTDNGTGMNADVRERIFEPFFTTKGSTGMGLGMAVSYSIIERHGGRLEVQSEPGHGSTFTVTLPTGQAALRKVACSTATEMQSANILVIDDDERVRDALAGMLSATDHYISQAAGGADGLAKMEREKFDLVFTDLSMPGMDGWAVASEIRRRWPDTRIVLITGYALPADTIKMHQELVNEIIFKPIRLDDIKNTISQILT